MKIEKPRALFFNFQFSIFNSVFRQLLRDLAHTRSWRCRRIESHQDRIEDAALEHFRSQLDESRAQLGRDYIAGVPQLFRDRGRFRSEVFHRFNSSLVTGLNVATPYPASCSSLQSSTLTKVSSPTSPSIS